MIGHAAPSKSGSSKKRILISVKDRRYGWVGRSCRTLTLPGEPWLESATHQRERDGALLRVHTEVRSKTLDTADIVREAIL